MGVDLYVFKEMNLIFENGASSWHALHEASVK